MPLSITDVDSTRPATTNCTFSRCPSWLAACQPASGSETRLSASTETVLASFTTSMLLCASLRANSVGSAVARSGISDASAGCATSKYVVTSLRFSDRPTGIWQDGSPRRSAAGACAALAWPVSTSTLTW
ncbi:Uncharacterised protein [Chromobacterium vaccinii]|nr:Uncharacterised protein [Chromobacterium vaccinii]